MRRLLIKLISIYQIFFSFDQGFLKILAPSGACLYQISCSEYTKQKILKFGVLKGSLMGLKRILSCHPWK